VSQKGSRHKGSTHPCRQADPFRSLITLAINRAPADHHT